MKKYKILHRIYYFCYANDMFQERELIFKVELLGIQ